MTGGIACRRKGGDMDASSTISLNTGRRMPILGLGTWELTNDTPGTIVKALELGYRMIDTSGDYGTQPGIAEGIRRSGVERSDLYIVTKVEEDEDPYEATKHNVGDLGLEYADLMLIHRPPPSGPGVDLWRGLLRARDDGLTRDVGVSNYSTAQIEELIRATGEVPTVNQIEWTPFGWDPGMLEYCRGRQILIQAYSPLTRGERLHGDVLQKMATELRQTPAQILLRWNLQVGTVPLPKANRHDHLEEDLDIFGFDLSDTQMDRLGRLNERWSSLGALQYV
jgi:diketogulonate reductase-like aldo/keto reductase